MTHVTPCDPWPMSNVITKKWTQKLQIFVNKRDLENSCAAWPPVVLKIWWVMGSRPIDPCNLHPVLVTHFTYDPLPSLVPPTGIFWCWISLWNLSLICLYGFFGQVFCWVLRLIWRNLRFNLASRDTTATPHQYSNWMQLGRNMRHHMAKTTISRPPKCVSTLRTNLHHWL